MFNRAHSRAGTLLVIGLTMIGLSSLVGCDGMGEVKVKIPDYASAQVRGVTLWRQAQSGEFVPQTIFELGELVVHGGVEYVQYTVEDDRFELGVPLAAPVTRDPDEPEALIVHLTVLTSGQSTVLKASTFNEAGESSLSTQTTEISV
ncbi:MAG: hypothetical protein ACQGVK_12495 [Myxococcota bacterium]